MEGAVGLEGGDVHAAKRDEGGGESKGMRKGSQDHGRSKGQLRQCPGHGDVGLVSSEETLFAGVDV